MNAKDKYGCTALHMASYKGNKAAVVDLLQCGADIEVASITLLIHLNCKNVTSTISF